MNINYTVYEFPTAGAAQSAINFIKQARNDVTVAHFTCGSLIILWDDKSVYYYKITDYNPKGTFGGL